MDMEVPFRDYFLNFAIIMKQNGDDRNVVAICKLFWSHTNIVRFDSHHYFATPYNFSL